MTRTELRERWAKMFPVQKDQTVAEMVLDLKPYGSGAILTPSGYIVPVPNYSCGLDAAHDVLRCMRERGWYAEIHAYWPFGFGAEHQVVFIRCEDSAKRVGAESDFLPDAICLAACLAMCEE